MNISDIIRIEIKAVGKTRVPKKCAAFRCEPCNLYLGSNIKVITQPVTSGAKDTIVSKLHCPVCGEILTE